MIIRTSLHVIFMFFCIASHALAMEERIKLLDHETLSDELSEFNTNALIEVETKNENLVKEKSSIKLYDPKIAKKSFVKVKKQIIAIKYPLINALMEIPTNILPGDWDYAFDHAFQKAFLNNKVNMTSVKDMIQFLKNKPATTEPFPDFYINGHGPLWYTINNYSVNNNKQFDQLLSLLLEKGAPITQDVLDSAKKKNLFYIKNFLGFIQVVLNNGERLDWKTKDMKTLYRNIKNNWGIHLYLIALNTPGKEDLANKLSPLYDSTQSFLEKVEAFFS